MGIEDTRKLTCPLPALEVASREESFVRLDDWMNENAIGRADFLKLDVEGSEVHVLRGAEKTLGDVRVVLSEVNFNDWIPSHFSQVDSLLRENGFLLWRLGNLIHHRLYSDLYRSRGRVEVSFYNSTMTEHADPGGMLFQGYGYWIKTDLVHKPPSSVQQALRDAILAEACGFSDLAGTLLSKCDSLPFDLDKVYVPERVPQFV